MSARWQLRVAQVVADAIREKRAPFGRAYATFLAGQVELLDREFGPSRARGVRAPNPYRVTVTVLRKLGYTQREIATILHLSQTAVWRLCRSKG